MFEEKDSHKSPIRFLAMFQHAVQPPTVVEPTERPFHLQPLAPIAPGMDICRRAAARNGDLVLTIGGNANKASLAQGLAVRFTVVAFVQVQAFGFAFPLADANAINRLQQFDKVVAVDFTQGEVEGRAIGVPTRWRFSPLNLCSPEYPTSVFAPF